MLNKESQILLSVERACNDLRKGFPVIITSNNVKLLVLSPETVSTEILDNISSKIKQPVKIILTSNRLNHLNKNDSEKNISALEITKQKLKTIPALCGLAEENNVKLPNLLIATKAEKDALKLARIAELIPSVITVELKSSFKDKNLLSIPANYINKYSNIASLDLTESCRVKLVLKNSIQSEIIAYRPNIGGKEHYAIIIGKPEKTPLIRIHSSCYTGDLLESLACDCHDQLHTAIELMSKTGGIILYMLQEGRGIGLINKLRAYAMKEKGFDTVDANNILGFDDDERLFEPAATILKQLKIKQINLLTNNPKKAKGLEDCGIKVTKCVPHIMETNQHNQQYLKTKSDRLGHKIGNVEQ
jgi:GTP cyclohydrolase II